MTLVVYVPAMRGGFIWDDDDNVTENSALRTWHGLARIWFDPLSTQQYYPLTHSSFWLQYQLWGLRPFPYHLANVLLHALGAVLLWLVLKHLSVPGAWLAAAVFAVHPVHVESVAWVTERKNVLSGVFFLGAILAYIRYAGLDRGISEDAKESPGRSTNRRFYAAAVLLSICAVMAKTATSSLPAVLLVLVWWKKGRLGWRDVLSTLPMFLAAAAMGSATLWIEKHHVGATGSGWDMPLVDKFILAGRVMWFYAGKLIWPAHLAFFYPRWPIDSSQLWQCTFPVGAAAVLVGSFLLRHRIGRAPFAAALIFVLALAPASGFFNVFFMRYSFVQDHFQYHASLALIALFAASITLGLRRIAAVEGRATALHLALPAAILITLGTLSWRQGGIYRDSETLYRSTIAKNPGAWIAHFNLAHLLFESGRKDEAISHFSEAVRLKPDDDELESNLGLFLAKAGRPGEASAHLTRALQLNPRSVAAHLNFGSVLLDQGKVDEAVSHFDAALKLNPDSPDAHCNMGVALRAKGQLNEAIAQQLTALEIQPDHAKAHINLGIIFLRQGKATEAAAHFTRALRVDPKSVEAHSNLGQCLLAQGKPEQAIDHYRRTLQLEPSNVEAANNLAWILATSAVESLRNGAEAVRHAEFACRSTGFKNPSLLDTLAAAYAEAGRFEEAVSTASQALALADAAGERGLASGLQGRLNLYEQHRPFRASPQPMSSG